MRIGLCCLLLTLALLARADGFAYGKAFQQLRETDQIAVAHLAPDGVTVDMYIAIDGIPNGESVTYILPFWHEPDGFRLEEMDGSAFRKAYVAPAHAQIVRNNRLARGQASEAVKESAALVGVVATGPLGAILFPVFTKKNRQDSSASARPLSPYRTVATAGARAELYRIKEQDLAALVARAKLPAAYAQHLRKYRTPYFAVMKLTGTGAQPDNSRGVHYHFRHPMPAGETYLYTYPLGTGAAWPKPIALTEVYLTCPRAYRLQVKAPTLGDPITYSATSYFASSALENKITPLSEDGTPLFTAHAQLPTVLSTNAWHVAYVNSNPGEDITVSMQPVYHPWQLPLAEFLLDERHDILILFAGLLLAWAFSIRWILRPQWRRNAQPDASFIGFGVRYALCSTLFLWMATAILALSVVPAYLTPALLILSLPAGVFLTVKLWIWWSKLAITRGRLTGITAATYLTASALFIAFAAALYALARMAEAAVLVF